MFARDGAGGIGAEKSVPGARRDVPVPHSVTAGTMLAILKIRECGRCRALPKTPYSRTDLSVRIGELLRY
jgi:hypothetical protein